MASNAQWNRDLGWGKEGERYVKGVLECARDAGGSVLTYKAAEAGWWIERGEVGICADILALVSGSDVLVPVSIGGVACGVLAPKHGYKFVAVALAGCTVTVPAKDFKRTLVGTVWEHVVGEVVYKCLKVGDIVGCGSGGLSQAFVQPGRDKLGGVIVDPVCGLPDCDLLIGADAGFAEGGWLGAVARPGRGSSVEVKRDGRAVDTGRVFVEVGAQDLADKKKILPRGLSTSRAWWYAFLVGRVVLFVGTEVLRDVVRDVARVDGYFSGGDKGRSLGVLVDFDRLSGCVSVCLPEPVSGLVG